MHWHRCFDSGAVNGLLPRCTRLCGECRLDSSGIAW